MELGLGRFSKVKKNPIRESQGKRKKERRGKKERERQRGELDAVSRFEVG